MSHKPRYLSSYRRTSGRVSPRECLLIVCEGAKTEPLYFKALRDQLRLQVVEVEVVGPEQGSAPISIVDRAIQLRDERAERARKSPLLVPYDAVWCVIDVEQYGLNPSLPRAIGKAATRAIGVALSNPCFEYWYLLHFERTGTPFGTPKAVAKALKRWLPRYGKADPGVFRQVYPHTDKAIKNADSILRSQWQYENDRIKRNPSTEVHEIVSNLRRIAAKPYPSGA